MSRRRLRASQAGITLAQPLGQVAFPKHSLVLTDLGFPGLALPHATLAQPAKKPRHRELEPWNKQINHLLAGVRVKIEHVLGSAKRCRIVSDTFRNLKSGFDDVVIGGDLWVA